MSDSAVFTRARELFGERFGLRFDAFNRELLEDGLARAATSNGCTVGELLDRVKASDAVMQAVLRQVTLGETYFFRHPEHFTALRERVVPERVAGSSHLRAWSAGCATGEETWSLAMLLADAAPGCEVSVLGTDINRAALEKARQASYGSWSLRANAATMPAQLTSRPDGTVRVAPLRARVRFEYLNLRDAIYPSLYTHTRQLDVIFCRNVLVYFRPAIVAEVVARFCACLADGGWLVLSALDAVEAPAGMELVRHGDTALWRKRTAPQKPAPARASSTPTTPTAAELASRAKDAADRGLLAEAAALAEAALREERSPRTLHLYALILGERGDTAGQAAVLRELVATSPDDVLGHLHLGLSPVAPVARAHHLGRVIDLLRTRADDDLLFGPDALAVSWVRKMAIATLGKDSENQP